MSEDSMAFPNTWEEFEKIYGFTDTEEIYTNGSRLIQTFRVEQWLDHLQAVPVRHGRWIYGNEFHWYTASCSRCGYKRTTDIKATNWNGWKYCPMCGARMVEDE